MRSTLGLSAVLHSSFSLLHSQSAGRFAASLAVLGRSGSGSVGVPCGGFEILRLKLVVHLLALSLQGEARNGLEVNHGGFDIG